MCVLGSSFPDCSGLAASTCSVQVLQFCAYQRMAPLRMCYVLAGDPAEAPIRSPKCPSETSPPGAHPEFHHSPGEELNTDVSKGGERVTSLPLLSIIHP